MGIFDSSCNATVGFSGRKGGPDFDRIILGFGMTPVVIIGIACNILVMVILSSDRFLKSSTTYVYLLAVAVADAVSLTMICGLYSQTHFNPGLADYLVVFVFTTILPISSTSSLLLTVTLTIDRYIFLRKPNRKGSKRPTAAFVIIGLIAICSTIVNLPRICAVTVDSDTGCIRPRSWAVSKDGWFAIYSLARLIFVKIVPVFIMGVFNCLLIRSVVKQKRSVIRHLCVLNHNQRSDTKSRSLTRTLIAATLLALVGEVPMAIFNPLVMQLLFGSWAKSPGAQAVLYWLFIPSTILMTLDYSGNFVIYCLLNKKFRRALMTKFRPWTTTVNDSISVSANNATLPKQTLL